MLTPNLMMPMMPMWFTWSTKTVVLFKSWKTETEVGYLFTCVAWIAICIIHEYLRSFVPTLVKPKRPKHVEDEVHLLSHGEPSVSSHPPHSGVDRSDLRVYMQTGLHAVVVTLRYAIMLVTMTYNVGLFLSVVAGLAIGYFLFHAGRHSGGGGGGCD